jgi:hypothetical protein
MVLNTSAIKKYEAAFAQYMEDATDPAHQLTEVLAHCPRTCCGHKAIRDFVLIQFPLAKVPVCIRTDRSDGVQSKHRQYMLMPDFLGLDDSALLAMAKAHCDMGETTSELKGLTPTKLIDLLGTAPAASRPMIRYLATVLGGSMGLCPDEIEERLGIKCGAQRQAKRLVLAAGSW